MMNAKLFMGALITLCGILTTLVFTFGIPIVLIYKMLDTSVDIKEVIGYSAFLISHTMYNLHHTNNKG